MSRHPPLPARTAAAVAASTAAAVGRITRIASSLLCSALLCLAAPPAQAGASASTSLHNVTLAVIDLTPHDAGTAGFTVDGFSSRLIVYTDRRNSGGSFEQTIATPTPYTAGAAQVDAGALASAAASTTGAPGAVAATASAMPGFGRDHLSSAESEQRLWLTLAPHTLLTVSGQVLTQALRTLYPGEGYRVFSWASVDLTDADMITGSLLTRESALIPGEATRQAANDEWFMLAYANPGDTARAVSLNFLAYTDVTVTAVPEPATWATLLAGLLLTGAAVTRGRRGCWP